MNPTLKMLAAESNNKDEDSLVNLPVGVQVFHRKEKGMSKFSDEELEDHQPFPTLEKALKSVPYTCGFNIEVKWTMQLKDGSFELQHPFELNNFMDHILKVS